MSNEVLSVREIEQKDIDPITNYWLGADASYLEKLGVDTNKMPAREEWRNMLQEQLDTPIEQKKSYCIIWQLNDEAVGHSNINKIIFGEEAYMHIHLWKPGLRKQGMGETLIRLTIPWFFEKYKLKKLYCEPYALNPAPNKVLEKTGFEFVNEYVTIPGWLNFEQPVKLWLMSADNFKKMK